MRLILALVGCLALVAPVEAQTEAAILRKLPPEVFQPYRLKDHPRTFVYFGADQVLGPIQRLRQNGAIAVAKRGDCDKVELSEFSTNQSSHGRYVVFVDCANGSRFYVDQSLTVTKR